MSPHPNSTHPIRRLTRLEQLTLNTWRWAAVALQHALGPSAAVLEFAAMHAVLASLRDWDDPVALFARHAHAQPEFQLIHSVLGDEPRPGLAHDILDTAFLLRWTELAATGTAPLERTPLPPARGGAPRSEA
jgi:hypothetical protein